MSQTPNLSRFKLNNPVLSRVTKSMTQNPAALDMPREKAVSKTTKIFACQ